MSTETEQREKHMHDVHEHLRHAATSDSPEEIRERMRRVELALQRHEKKVEGSDNSESDKIETNR